MGPAARYVIDSFQTKLAGRAFNSRSDLNPREFRAYLPYMSILEIILGGPEGTTVVDARFRLVGTKIGSLYGENTGRSLGESQRRAVHERACKIMSYSIQEKTIAVAHSGKADLKSHGLDATLVYVPFSDDDETVKQFLVFEDIRKSSSQV